jgi:hypothetical protein
MRLSGGPTCGERFSDLFELESDLLGSTNKGDSTKHPPLGPGPRYFLGDRPAVVNES